MQIVNKIIDRCEFALACIAGAALVFLLLAISFSTFSRFLFNNPMSNLIEYSSYSLVYIAFLGSPYILRSHGHVNVDMLENALPAKGRQILRICTNILGMLISAITCYYGTVVTASNIADNVHILDSMNTPQWVLIIAIPIGTFFLAVQFVRNCAEEVKKLREMGGEKK